MEIKKIKKVHINKSDEAASVAEKVIDTDADEIILSVPKFSKLSESLSNFHLIKREADVLNKKVIVESVDDKVIELCRMSGLECLNPIFIKSRRQFSDIAASKPKEEKIIKAKSPAAAIYKEAGEKKPEKNAEMKAAEKVELVDEEFKPRSRWPRRIILLIVLVAVVFVGVKIARVLPRVEIKIITRKVEWNYKDSITVDKTISEINEAIAKIPGQVFVQKNNLRLAFDATGRKAVERKASGKILVYNGYSSSPQPLSLGTRFESPDGKIFKTTKAVTVPGAQIVEGKIVSSSIEIAVTADKAGEAYNIAPSRFTIPGFKGSPKYLAFYGESKEAMIGGFVGEIAYPTDEDSKKAKDEIVAKLNESLKTLILTQLPQGFKIIDGASEFNFLNQSVDKAADSSSKFYAFAEAQMSLIAFLEKDVSDLLDKKMKTELGQDFAFKSDPLSLLNYGLPRLDIKAGKMTFPIDLKSVTTRVIDIDILKERISGKPESDVKSLLFALPGLESAKISFWPFWVKSAPTNKQKITISVE